MTRPHRLLILMLLLGSCASSNPRLYTLEMRLGPVRPGAARMVVVRSVGIPRYLDRLEIVRGAGADRLAASDDDWWAEPLRVMTRRVMVDDLTQRLPGADVLAGDSVIAAHPDAEVQVELQRFEADGAGQVWLAGYAAVEMEAKGGAKARTTSRLSVRIPVAGTMIGNQTDAMSTALGQAADLIAARLAP